MRTSWRATLFTQTQRQRRVSHERTQPAPAPGPCRAAPTWRHARCARLQAPTCHWQAGGWRAHAARPRGRGQAPAGRDLGGRGGLRQARAARVEDAIPGGALRAGRRARGQRRRINVQAAQKLADLRAPSQGHNDSAVRNSYNNRWHLCRGHTPSAQLLDHLRPFDGGQTKARRAARACRGTGVPVNAGRGQRACASAKSSPRSAYSWRAMMVLRSRTRHCSAGDSRIAGPGSVGKPVRSFAHSRNACSTAAEV
jgi:hypothetical protein